MIKKLFARTEAQPTFKNLALIVKLFRVAVRNEQSEEPDTKMDKYFQEPEDYSGVIQFAFLRLPELIKEFYKVDFVCQLSKEHLKNQVHVMIFRGFFIQAIKFLESTIDTQEEDEKTMLYVVQALGNMNQVFAAFDSILKKSLNLLIQLWANHPSLKVKLHSFVQVRRVFTTIPEHLQQTILKKFYAKFSDAGKHVLWRNFEAVNFMVNCLVELCNSNMTQAYQVLYVALQQFVKQIRHLSENKNEENVRSLYSQQTINILKFFTSAICTHKNTKQLGELMPPLVQIIQAVLDYYQSVDHYTFQLHLTKQLIRICEAYKVQMNLLPYLLRMLACTELKRHKLKSSVKPYDFDIGFQIKQKYRQSSQFWNEFCQQIVNQIVQFLATFSKTSYFTEYTIYTEKQLKRIASNFGFDGNKIRIKKLIRLIRLREEGESALETEAQRIQFDEQEIIKQKVLAEKERIERGEEDPEESDMEQEIRDQKDQEFVFEEIKKYKEEKAKEDESADYDVSYEGDPELQIN